MALAQIYTKRKRANLCFKKRYRSAQLLRNAKSISVPQLKADHLRDKKYKELLKEQFNILATENAFKFEEIHPKRYSYSFDYADKILSFAEANGMKVRGHTLVWHYQLPSWITNANYTRKELLNILHEHIKTVVSHYKGRVYAWDVVNEAINEDGILRETIWLKNIGPEYIDLAFRWAHEADPEALLFYNDFGIESLNNKSNAVYKTIESLLKKACQYMGLGFRCMQV
jgi:endo-1,4-beta-xylanase